jgi:hypothetical protein
LRNIDIFWNLVKEIGWGTKTTDIDKLKNALNNEYNIEFLISMKDIAIRQRRALGTIMDEHALKETGSIASYWNVSDDGFWDLTAHIVGLGKEVYDYICRNPIYARTIAYAENFEYIFNNIEVSNGTIGYVDSEPTEANN